MLLNYVEKLFKHYYFSINNMKTNLEEKYNEILMEAKADKNLIGFYLSGSRGKNKETKHSDYDIHIVVKDKVINKYKEKYGRLDKKLRGIGFWVFSLTEFKKHAEFGSPFEWDRASFTHVKAIIDRNNQIQKYINEKSIIPKKIREKYVSGFLDGYINYVYRSLKCFRDGNKIGARLEAARSINFLLTIIFGVEGRITPYYKYLDWELKNYPLKKLKIKPTKFINLLLKILETADIKTQQELFLSIEKLFRKEGYGYVYDKWESDSIEFIRTFNWNPKL